MSNYSTNQEEINQESPKDEVEKKGNMLWGKSGDEFTIISNYFIKPKYTNKLKLSATEKILIQTILTYKHNNNMPFPSYQRLADDMETSPRYIMKSIKQLEEKEVLNVIRVSDDKKGNQSNRYDFTPLIKKLEQIVLSEKQQKSHEDTGSSPLVNNRFTPPSEQQVHKGSEQQVHPKKRTEKEIYKKENIYNPPTPQKEQKQKNESFQENKNLGERDRVLHFIKNNFTKDISAMLMSVESKHPEYISIEVLEGYKDALIKTKSYNKSGIEMRIPLMDMIDYLSNGNKIRSYTGFLINKIRNPYQQYEKENQSDEVIPEWLKQQQKQREKESSYESDYSKYNFTKSRNLIFSPEEEEKIWQEIREEGYEN